MRLYRTSADADPYALRPGEDLVLEVALEHGLAVPDGVAIEDYLSAGARVDVDRAAIAALGAWRAARGDDLRFEGVDLGEVAEVELLASCFLPAELIRRGLAAVCATGVVEAIGFEASALGALPGFAPSGCDVRGAAAPPPPPPERGGRRDALVHAIERATVPPWPRGDVVCVAYWHLASVYTALARRRRGPRPVPAGIGLAGLQRADIARALVRGGWGGSSGARARAESAARVAARAAELGRTTASNDPARGLDSWALAIATRNAGAAPAQLNHFRRALRSARLIVMPFDSPAEQRVLVAAGQAQGVPALVVQHGFRADLNDPDLTRSDHVAVWSEHDRAALAPHAAGRIAVTGNPGVDPAAGRAVGPHGSGRTVVLVEYPGRLSAQVGTRIALRHVGTALHGLALARPGSEVIVRPHPFDAKTDYVGALAVDATGLRVSVDRTTAIEPLLLSADLCVGAMSTATLQAAVLGVPTVFLDVSGAAHPWPFDGAPGTLSVARDAGQLATAAAAPRDAAGLASDALGMTGHATSSVLALIDELASRPA